MGKNRHWLWHWLDHQIRMIRYHLGLCYYGGRHHRPWKSWHVARSAQLLYKAVMKLEDRIK